MNLYEKLVSVLEDLRQDPNQEHRGFVHGCRALMTSEGKIYIYQFGQENIIFELEEGAIINHVNPKTHKHPGGYAHILREFTELLAEKLEAKLGQEVNTRYKRYEEFSELLAGSKNWKKELRA